VRFRIDEFPLTPGPPPGPMRDRGRRTDATLLPATWLTRCNRAPRAGRSGRLWSQA